ncbi:hypothetical protein GCM10012275_20650 [Longimycelium tulufanense]|uniref:Uncharacterized protein n=1 Tax=Longimycelium tulufanense TaxID=907463 RepID=A0A8J3CD22_9PSEU|nr:DUF6002 family protein [Longimycelium tulufanense]GGM49616.1 hypothetical protein GCM10012275_20650 [Longimycelium tulufanense]
MTNTQVAVDLFNSTIRTTNSDSLITRYYNGVKLASSGMGRTPPAAGFAPAHDYPELDDRWEEYFSVARAAWRPVRPYQDHDLALLDLMRNPATRTTKTTASLLMVARAVTHIHRTGERILIFTPSSGNKAIALRDAVARALQLGLVAPDQLRIATLTPLSTLHKFRRSYLTESDELRRLNPVMVYSGGTASDVKEIGTEFVAAARQRADDLRIWYSLDINNYKIADACRAFFEHEFGGRPRGRRLHAHAVSSAYGLLGYQHGLDTMARVGISVSQPGFLLVQHMATSDMVRHYLREGVGTDRQVDYHLDAATSLLCQDASPHFPQATWSVGENLEPTFYTNNPPTAPEMTRLISTHGGSAIVVSLYECLTRYATVRNRLGGAGCALPADPRTLGEWSLVMGLTGVLNAVDRGLVGNFDEIVLHGSGLYFLPGEQGIELGNVTAVDNADDVLRTVL